MDDSIERCLLSLDAAPATVDVFIRDDDVGWADQRLFALLELTAAHEVPIDLAVIPQAMDTALARELRSRHDAAPGLVGLHQHGFSHANHEPEGRPCEFGPARALVRQRADLRLGRERLRGHLGQRLDAIFTPPWNRCAEQTPLLLQELGICALSRAHGATAQSILPELPVGVDWSRCEREARLAAVAHPTAEGGDPCLALAQAFAARVQAGGPVGVMLHHAAMDAESLARLDTLLRRLRRHPRLRWRAMRDLLGLSLARPQRMVTRLAA